MDTAKWPQEVGLGGKSMEEVDQIGSSKPMLERKLVRPQKDQALNCPRCNSTNTKFCYYNNYSLTQPRFFCKTCKRYWTQGGSLRNIPVGGGSRKNKRSSSSSSSSKVPDLNPPSFSQFSSQNPKTHEGQDLNLALQPTQDHRYQGHVSQFLEVLPKVEINNISKDLNSFVSTTMGDSNMLYASVFSLQEFKPTLGFSGDGLGNRYGSVYGVQENGGRLVFPFGGMKEFSSTSDLVDENKGQGNASGYWNGIVGGGSW